MDVLSKTCIVLLVLMTLFVFSIISYNLIIDPTGIMCKKQPVYQIIRMDYKND